MIRAPEPFTAALPQPLPTDLDDPFELAPAVPIGTVYLWDGRTPGVRPIALAWERIPPNWGGGGSTPGDPDFRPPTEPLPGFMADLGTTVFEDLTSGRFVASGDWQAIYDETEFHASILDDDELDLTLFTLA